MIDLFGHPISPNPRKRDQTNAERQARHVAQRTELTEIPACKDPERRAAAEDCLITFGTSYAMRTKTYKGILKRPPSERMKEYVRELQHSIEHGGLLHVRLPRGAGKTSWIKIAIVWGLSTGRIKYGVAIAATGPLASRIIRDIWNFLENSELYAEDFPEVSFPIRALEGMFQRAAGQTINGIRTQIKQNNSEIRLPIVKGTASSGGILVAIGAQGAMRGLVDGSFRPDYVLLDDIQTRKKAKSPTMTQDLIDWVQEDVMGLGGDELMSIAMASTPIGANDISEQFADPELHPEWKTVSFPLVISWPVREDLWETYAEIYKRDGMAQATEFYRANREQMDAGCEVIDPEAYDKKHELSGIQRARNLLIRMNKRSSFDAEYQLITRKPMQMLTVNAKHLKQQTNGYERGVLPHGTLETVCFIDVMSDSGLHFSVVAFGPLQTAAIIDYGIWPGNGKRIVRPNAPVPEIEAKLSKAETELVGRILSTPYRRADGRIKAVHAIWLDHGWQTVVGVRVCDLFRRRGYQNVFTCAGRSSMYYDPNGKHVVATGFQVDFRENDGVRFAMQNSDYWKETAQRAFQGTPLQPGSVSLWGNDPEEHDEYCNQIANRVLSDKAQSKKGVEIYKWTLKPGTEDHFLDTLSGAFAMASWYRFWDNAEVFRLAAQTQITPAEGTIIHRPQPVKRRRKYRSAKVPVSY